MNPIAPRSAYLNVASPNVARRSVALPLAFSACGLMALLSGCQGSSPVPAGSLPAPLAGVSVSGVFSGSSHASGMVAGKTLFGPATVSVLANLSEVGGVLSGHEDAYVDSVHVSGGPVNGVNQGGSLSFPVSFAFCGQTITLTLSGTLNPADTLNFAQVTQVASCQGQSGQLVVDAFTAKRTQ